MFPTVVMSPVLTYTSYASVIDLHEPFDRTRRRGPADARLLADLAAWLLAAAPWRGTQARLYVHDQPQPALVVNDLKTGPDVRGAVALWIDLGTRACFRNLTVTPATEP